MLLSVQARACCLLLVQSLVACHKDAPADLPGGPPTGQAWPGGEGTGLPQAALDDNNLADMGAAFSGASQIVRRQPTEAKEVDDPTVRKKKASNFVASVLRGEQVTVVERHGDWARVRLSDGKSGWVKNDNVIDAPRTVLATNLARVKTFLRPDLLALNASTQLDPGSLLFLMRTKDQFSEVDTGATNTVWVLSAQITADAQEVEAAKLINRARILKQRNDPDAEAALDLAKTHLGLTRLVQTLLLPPPPPPSPVPDPCQPVPSDANAPPGNNALPAGMLGQPRVDGPAPVPH